MVHWHVLECASCRKIYALLLLPKHVTYPGRQEMATTTEIVVIIRDGLRQLTKGAFATTKAFVRADASYRVTGQAGLCTYCIMEGKAKATSRRSTK